MGRKEEQRRNALQKELALVEKQEKRMASAAMKARPPAWKTELEKRVPEKVRAGLESAFCKGFSFVFDHGRGIIEKGIDREAVAADFAIRDYAVQVRGGRRDLRQLRRGAARSNLKHLAVTAAEGVGLGALGIGLPDIVLFLGTLLMGVYETALSYGFEYESLREQRFILKLLETALSGGEDWSQGNAEVDGLMEADEAPAEDSIKAQMQQTASVFAMDMLLLKFLQGMPVIGILGGLSDPVYYGRIMKYVQLKYRKRYLLKQK